METPSGVPSGPVPDRLRLPFTFDPSGLRADLTAIEESGWIDHFVPDNYEGRWTVLPLRAPAGSLDAHPILQVVSHPDQSEFVDTPLLERCPHVQAALESLGFPLGAVRLMRLDPGSLIKTHVDVGLAYEEGSVRLHIPVATNPGVEFVVNDRPVTMHEGECWYLRLSDPHSVRNGGGSARVHVVIDAPVGPELETVFARAMRAA